MAKRNNKKRKQSSRRDVNGMHIDWRPGEPLPELLYSVLTTGLGGCPEMIKVDDWVDAMVKEVETKGMVRVMEIGMTVTSELLGAPRRVVLSPDAASLVTEQARTLGVRQAMLEIYTAHKEKYGESSNTYSVSNSTLNDQESQWLTKNIDMILAYGWHGFSIAGRGVVVLDKANQRFDHVDKMFGYALMYAPLEYNKGAVPGGREFEWPGDTERMAREYDPENRIVLLIVRPDNSMSAMVIGGFTSPKQAYEDNPGILEDSPLTFMGNN